MLLYHCSIHHSAGFSLLSSFHGDNSKVWTVCLTLNAVEDCVCVHPCVPHDILCALSLCEYPLLGFYSDIKSLSILTRKQTQKGTNTHNFPALDLIFLLMLG